MTNPTRITKQADLAAMVHEHNRFENLSHLGRIQERLRRLRAFIEELANTEQGRKDLQQRITLLGPCHPIANETPSAFYGRLRQWLDKDLTRHIRRLHREPIAHLESQDSA